MIISGKKIVIEYFSPAHHILMVLESSVKGVLCVLDHTERAEHQSLLLKQYDFISNNI